MEVLENRFVNMTAQDLLDAAGALAGQQISGSGPAVAEFERDLAAKFGSRHAVTVCSGTTAIYCAMRAVGVGAGDEVVLPASAVAMSGLPALLLGAKVVFADTTTTPGFGFNVSDVEAVLTARTKAVLTVPLWGYPIAMDEIVNLCLRKGIPLLEDVAQAHGTTWKKKPLGTFGAVGCFSTHERKLITTGEGGFVLTDSEAVAEAVNVFRRYGITGQGAGYALGLNLKMSAVSASVGRTQVRKLTEKIAARHDVAQAIRKGLGGLPWLKELPVDPDGSQNYYSLVFRVVDGTKSAKALDKHLANRQILSDTFRYGFQPLFRYPLFAAGARSCPNAERIVNEVFTLPCHEGMSDSDIARVVEAVRLFG